MKYRAEVPDERELDVAAAVDLGVDIDAAAGIDVDDVVVAAAHAAAVAAS